MSEKECIGKEAFDTWALANEVCTRMRARKSGSARKLHVYACRKCRLFHIGSSWRKKHAAHYKRKGA
jgi:adenine-specific DNA methylase